MQDLLQDLTEFANRLRAADESTRRLALTSGPHQKDEAYEEEGSSENATLFERKALDVKSRLGDAMREVNQALVETSVAVDEWQKAESSKVELSRWLADKETQLAAGNMKQYQIQARDFYMFYYYVFRSRV